MDNQNYLLTYQCLDDDRKIRAKYAWFDTEKELLEFIEESKFNIFQFKVIDSIEIIDSRDINIK